MVMPHKRPIMKMGETTTISLYVWLYTIRLETKTKLQRSFLHFNILKYKLSNSNVLQKPENLKYVGFLVVNEQHRISSFKQFWVRSRSILIASPLYSSTLFGLRQIEAALGPWRFTTYRRSKSYMYGPCDAYKSCRVMVVVVGYIHTYISIRGNHHAWGRRRNGGDSGASEGRAWGR